MTQQEAQDITGLLEAWTRGDTEALDRLVVLLYPKLRRIARRHLDRRRPAESVESASLANEAYIKLARAGGIRCESRVHFLALCSQIMRRILVDHARRRGYAKRGGDAVCVALDEVLLAAQGRGVDLVALDDALEALARIDPAKEPGGGAAVLRRPRRGGDRGGPRRLAGNREARLEAGTGVAVRGAQWRRIHMRRSHI